MNPREYEVMFRVEQRYFWYRGMRAFARRLLPEVFGADRVLRLLDAGCGTGANLVHVSGGARRTFGVDLSWDALRLTRRRGVARLAGGSVTRLPYLDGSFDVVTCQDVVNTVAEDASAVAELARVTAPGGIVYITVAAFRALRGEHDRAVRTVRRYRKEELLSIVRGAGLVVERATYANTVLSPPIWLLRTLRRRLAPAPDDARATSDFPLAPSLLNGLLTKLLEIEAALAAVVPLPFGVTLIVKARKPSLGETVSGARR